MTTKMKTYIDITFKRSKGVWFAILCMLIMAAIMQWFYTDGLTAFVCLMGAVWGTGFWTIGSYFYIKKMKL